MPDPRPRLSKPHAGRRAPPGVMGLRRQEFLRSPEGRKIILYLAGLVALALTLLGGVKGRKQSPESQSETHAESGPSIGLRVVKHPPESFVPSGVLHALRTVEDGGRVPSEAAVRAVLQHLKAAKGTPGEVPESRPDPIIDLDVREAISNPERFRGGIVKCRGRVTSMETRAFEYPEAPEGVIYYGILAEDETRFDTGIAFEMIERPPEFEVGKETIEIEGVFVQNILFEPRKGPKRSLPFLFASSFRIVSGTPKGEGLDKTLYYPVILGLILAIAFTTYVLVRRIERRRAAGGLAMRPPRTET